jgi:SAM-dependent methyltransferase
VTSSAPDSPLEFTGERFTPECVREIWYEHWHRYAFARALARGRRVLDAACGEGFGSALLAATATSVCGVDIAPAAVAHARARYGGLKGLAFREGDCTRLDDLPDASFDLIVSFETLEHVQEQERMLDGFARLLAPDGVLLISTPDKHLYTDVTGVSNEYHVRELYRPEFEALIDARFPQRRLFGQKLMFASAIWDGGSGPWSAAILDAEGGLRPTLEYAPLYYVAACARQRDVLDALPSLSLFGDATQSIYAHYEDEIRKGIRAGHRILELEAQLARLEARCAMLEGRPPGSGG